MGNLFEEMYLKEEIQMANKCILKGPVSLAIKEMQIKSTAR